jgi:hypothetical protein
MAAALVALAAPAARASDDPIREVHDEVIAMELVAAVLEVRLERFTKALEDPDTHVILVDGEPMLIDAQRVDDLAFVGEQLIELHPELQAEVNRALEQELGVSAEAVALVPQALKTAAEVKLLSDKLNALEEEQAGNITQDLRYAGTCYGR